MQPGFKQKRDEADGERQIEWREKKPAGEQNSLNASLMMDS